MSVPSRYLCFGLALLCAAPLLSGQSAASKRKSPTSKFYVAEIKGEEPSTVNTGEVIEELTEKSVFDAEGTTIETKAETTTAIVLSNGTGVSFGKATQVLYNRFAQEPFQPNRTDLQTEPSVSITRALITGGSIGICTSRLVAGSSMVYETPHGSINIRGMKVAITVSDAQTVVSLIEGDVTVRGDNLSSGELLRPGDQAILRARGPGLPPEIITQPIPDADMKAADDLVAGACMSRQRVYFDVADRNQRDPFEGPEEGGPGIVPIIVPPVDVIGPIVSPAR
jgi:hypothetical protein